MTWLWIVGVLIILGLVLLFVSKLPLDGDIQNLLKLVIYGIALLLVIVFVASIFGVSLPFSFPG